MAWNDDPLYTRIISILCFSVCGIIAYAQDKPADLNSGLQIGLGLHYVMKPEMQTSRDAMYPRASPAAQLSLMYSFPISKVQGFRAGIAVSNLSYNVKVISRMSSTNAIKSTAYVTPGLITSFELAFYNQFNLKKYQLELHTGFRLNVASKYKKELSRAASEVNPGDTSGMFYLLQLDNTEVMPSARRFPGLILKLKIKRNDKLSSPWDFYLVYHYQRERHSWQSFETGLKSPSLGELRYVNTYFGFQVCYSFSSKHPKN
ncbi:hypothetical protein GYB22_11740 [bacterium]|nr:hypothetical protein [bacterium]